MSSVLSFIHPQNQTSARQSQHRSFAPILQWCCLPVAAFRCPYPAERSAFALSCGGGQKCGTYVVCYLLSQTVFHEVYLFEWTAAHYYLCLWVASVAFCFLEMYRAALITTAGNWTGILIGQVLGDFIIKINATKITPDMYIGKVWQLKAHYGVLIWLLVFLLSFIIGMIVEKKNHC